MLCVVALLLGTASMGAALLQDVGSCDFTVATDSSFDFNTFYKENGGVWTFAKVPVTKSNKDLVGMFQTSKPTLNGNAYTTTFYGKNKNQNKNNVIGGATVVDSGSGHVTATSVDGKNTVYKVSFVKYVPGSFAYFTICSDEGGDSVVDRYVVAHKRLTPAEEAEVKRIESQYKFSGSLRDI